MPEYNRIPGYEAFRREIIEPIDSVEGESVRRGRGQIRLMNEQGESVQLLFATSVHEKNPGTAEASTPELEFLRGSLIERRDAFSTLFVEQGSPLVTENNIERVLTEIGSQNPLLGQAMAEKKRQVELRRAESPYTSEIKILPEQLSTLGKRSINFDLILHPEAYDYILNNRGLQEAVHHACRRLSGETVHWQRVTPGLAVELLKRVLAAPFDVAEVQQIASEYVLSVAHPSEFWDANPVTESDAYRETFMARRITKMPKGSYGLLCHTGHLVQVVQLLVNNISSIELQGTEIAQHKLEHYKKRLQDKKKTNQTQS